ncbi:MAG: SDR family oxidoreductase [Alphaproteobacteria bacterium]|mgnify:CR=1 FL=1|jgi:NAD(P)-dependent dehydrogenase (short-subunit alcohol dehydrogenase family)|nr:SDR family oxidoreductase [Alphaproteobacteria bacterium]MBT4966206.1 SDR family oxidoreductase [Alphaproteobacteria bacterium]MBT5159603.1 SDR family oxidoreductase [Alphaproteobacteria bacterium]MBT5918670.1 SDR family oxidoreductase [Alphaproteobacteria bacterium]MBT6387790.1 SDR family oxidoreductase [Alphaproteobacteria bacterium]
MNLFDLTGKVAVITGSTKGIGKAIAEEMAAHGAKVVITSRKGDVCEEVAQSIRDTGGEAVAIPCNISHKEQMQALVAETRKVYGKIDILVCNAAANPHYGPTLTIPDSAFEKVMDVNIKSNHWLVQMVAPEMVTRKDGSIIIVSSIGGYRGSATLGAYCISKAADMQMVRNLATELGPDNIRANCIAPGLVKTDFARALWENPEMADDRIEGTPLRRLGEPRDIAGIAIYLASEAGSWTTGQTITVDGGVTSSSGR